jgi:hypothetical protein
MANIFGTTQQYKPTRFVTADKLLLTVGGTDTPAEFLLQNVNLQFNRPVAPLFEIGTSNTYFAPGRAMGQMSIQRVVGAKRITEVLGVVGEGIWTTNIDEAAADASNRTVTLKEIPAETGSTNQNPMTYKITGAIVEGYGASTDANGLLLQESVTIRFSDLSFGGNDAGTANGGGTRT